MRSDRASITLRLDGPLLILTPWREGNRAFLAGLAARPDLRHIGGGQWSVRRSLFSKAVRACADRFGAADVWTEHLLTQKCTPSCADAKRDECVCSCGYTNHKGGMVGWERLGETLVRQDVSLVHHLVQR